MELVDLSTPLGIALAIVGIWLFFKVVKWVLKIAFVGLVVFGVYLAFFA